MTIVEHFANVVIVAVVLGTGAPVGADIRQRLAALLRGAGEGRR